MGGLPAALLALGAGLMGASALLYRRMLGSRSPDEAWVLGRASLAAAAAGLLAAAAGLGGVEAPGLAAAVASLFAVQAVMVRYFSGKAVARGRLIVEGRSYNVEVIDTPSVTAFTLVAAGRIYASRRLLEALGPWEAAAVLAHEAGHRESLRPVPPWLAMASVVAGLAWLLEAVLDAALSGNAAEASAASVIAASGWLLYNWSWEHLADIYSLRATGLAALAALHRMTGAAPEPPRLPRLVSHALRSLRPRSSAGLLVNPHPPPQLRLWLLARLAGGAGNTPSRGQGGAWAAGLAGA